MRPEVVEADPEQPVIEAIQQGDADALAELVRRQGAWVRGVIFGAIGRADELDDITQKVWMQVWRQARKLDDPAKWRPWLYSIARHAATDAGRGKQRRHRLLHGLFRQKQTVPSYGAPADATLLDDERSRQMLDAIAALPALYREPFVLRHVENWSYAKIGETLGLPVDTVETRLVRARRLLRERLKDMSEPRALCPRAGIKPAARLVTDDR